MKHRVTLFGWNCRKGGSDLRAASSLACLANIMATNNDIFKESSLRLVVAISSKGGRVNALRTSCKDHWVRGDQHGGRILRSPLRNLSKLDGRKV